MRMILTLFAGFVALNLAAQTDGSFELGQDLWNGDWLSKQRDQMVHGEGYRGYPGPLPKLLVALGLDPDHPAVDFELRFNVDRESPYWYGQCNGWAAAAVMEPDPPAVTVHGVKLEAPEVKALLTSIYKDNVRNYVSGGQQGLSPRGLDITLSETIGKNRPVIFDVDITEAIWNFPVVSYSRSSTNAGGFVYVDMTVGYLATLEMSDFESGMEIDYQTYSYRYPEGSSGGGEWLGESVDDHPRVAWTPSLPYSPGLWQLTANRYFNLNTIDRLYALAQDPDAEVDRMEPNDSAEQATPLNRQLVLGSLHDNDIDHFRMQVAKDEVLAVHITSYDGGRFSAVLKSDSGAVIDAVLNTFEADFQYTAVQTRDYLIELHRGEGTMGPIFYDMVFPEPESYLKLSGEESSVQVLNYADEAANVYGRTAEPLAPGATTNAANIAHDGALRASREVIWAREHPITSGLEKTYAWDHEIAMDYLIPHLTFRNQWDTRLDLQGMEPASRVGVRVYASDGTLLEQADLFLDENARFQGSLRSVLTGSGITQGAWFELDAPSGSLQGAVEFVRDQIGDRARIPIQRQPLNGEIPIVDIKDPSEGWTGIAFVNTSGVRNEIMYRAYDGKNIVDEGLFHMQPGEKWLNSARAFAPSLTKGATLMFFAQYDVDTIVIQHRFGPRETYGHRGMSYFNDAFTQTFATVPADWKTSEFVCANFNSSNVHVLFEGYNADGVLQGRFHTILSNALKPFEVRRAPVSQIMENGVVTGDVDAIAYFKVSAVAPVLCYEIFGDPANESRTVSRLIPIYEDP